VTTATPTAPAPKKQRGRENAWDMVRSLGLCLLVVVPIWFLAQPPKEAEQRIRVVDQQPEVDAWQAGVPGAPAPQSVPDAWQATVAQGVRSPTGIRLGWVTAPDRYVEFAASSGASGSYVEDLTGAQRADGTVDVDGTTWERWVEEDGSVSLVRTTGDVVVVVGTVRSTATDAELQALARSVRP
jgi:hypothetical protein